MNFHKNDYPNKPRFKSPRSERPHNCNYYVEIRDGDDPMRAYRKIKKKIKDDKFFEQIKERQYYRKPSFKRREKAKKRVQVLRRLQRNNDTDRFMGGFGKLY